jgi:hypothetical protein
MRNLFLLVIALLVSLTLAQQYVQQGSKLIGSPTVKYAEQGYSVAISGNGSILASGSYQNNPGYIWVFERSSITWIQKTYLNCSTNRLGSSLAMSTDGSTIAAGDTIYGGNIGIVCVFFRTGSTWASWALQRSLQGNDNTGTSNMGTSVALSANGNTLAFGGSSDNGNIGATWVFTRNVSGLWNQQGPKLVANDSIGASKQGCSVSLSADGNFLASGGYYDNSGYGAIWMWARYNSAWTQQAKLTTSGTYNQFGWSVSLSSDARTVVTGAYYDNNIYDGAMWVYVGYGSSWTQQGPRLQGSGVGQADQGYAVSVSGDGNTFVSGAPVANSGNGGAFMFTRTAGVWNQLGVILVGSGKEGLGASQGGSIAISNDSKTFVMGGTEDGYYSVGAIWGFASPDSLVSFTPTQSPTSSPLPAIDLPIAVPVTFGPTHAGLTTVFTLQAKSGVDGQIPPSPYRVRDNATYYNNATRMSFPTLVQGTYGALYGYNGTSCTVPLVKGVWYAPLGQQNFTFCYVGQRYNPGLWGNDSFPFEVLNRLNMTSEPSNATFIGSNPLYGCPTTTPIPSNNENVCTSYGYQNPSIIPLLLQGNDSFGGRNLSFKLTSLPSSGTLYLSNNTLDPAYINSIIPVSNTSKPNLYYRGNTYFFTRWGCCSYANPLGVGFNGCSISVAPGCPDTFYYLVVASDGNTSSLNTYNVQVEGVFNPLPQPIVPDQTIITLSVNVPYFFNTVGDMFGIVDMNQDEFMVLMAFNANQGLVGLQLTPEQQKQYGLTFIDCAENPDFGCSQLSFYGYPSILNAILPHLFIVAETSFTGSGRILISWWMPSPDGVTNANVLDLLDSSRPDYQLTLTISLGTPTPAPTVAEESDFATAFWTMVFAIIVFMALAISVMFTCGIQWSPTIFRLAKRIFGDVIHVVAEDLKNS